MRLNIREFKQTLVLTRGDSGGGEGAGVAGGSSSTTTVFVSEPASEGQRFESSSSSRLVSLFEEVVEQVSERSDISLSLYLFS